MVEKSLKVPKCIKQVDFLRGRFFDDVLERQYEGTNGPEDDQVRPETANLSPGERDI